MEEVNFSVTVTGKDLFRFLLQHSYRGASLVVNALITLGALVFFFLGLGTDPMPKSVALLLLALLFTVIYPVQLYTKALRQAKNPVFQKPIGYRLDEQGIEMSQGEVKEAFTWDQVFCIRETRQLLLVYTGRVYACIWPKRALGSLEPQVRGMLEKHLSETVYRRK